jgi:hypothetical protein
MNDVTLRQVWLQAYCAALNGIMASPVPLKIGTPGELAAQLAKESVEDFKLAFDWGSDD